MRCDLGLGGGGEEYCQRAELSPVKLAPSLADVWAADGQAESKVYLHIYFKKKKKSFPLLEDFNSGYEAMLPVWNYVFKLTPPWP